MFNLDRQVLGTLFRHELKMLLRDKRTVIFAFLGPLVLLPGYFWLTSTMQNRADRMVAQTTYRYAVTGDLSVAEPAVAEALDLPGDTLDTAPIRLAGFQRVDGQEPFSSLLDEDLHLVVEGLSAAEWRQVQSEVGDETARGSGANAADTIATPVLRLHFRGNSSSSVAARDRMEERLERIRETRRGQALARLGFALAPDSVISVSADNLATPGREGGAMLGRFLTMLIAFMMLTGGSVIAVDAIAGEKERGTLENLLTTAARRSEIIFSKQLAVITVAFAIAAINLLSLIFYLNAGVLDLPESLRAVRIPIAGWLTLLVLFVPVTILVSSVLLLVSGFSKSYKEFQMYFFPVFLLILTPTAAALLPGLLLRSLIVLVPLANISVAVRDILLGRFDVIFIVLAFAVTGLAAAWAARLAANTLSTERLITASELDRAELFGGPDLFPRRVLRWFGAMWAIFWIVGLWMSDRVPVEGQVAVNLLGIFLGSSILMIRRYRLPIRETLALRAPRPAVWPAILIAAPAAYVTGIGLAELIDLFVPVPREVIESFSQTIAPDETPLWQLFLFIAVVPGIIEEIAFRGLLLNGLHRKLRPVTLVLAVGIIFGLFHVSIFRIGPTAYLGMLLTTSVLLTGSIYPAMLWHFLNNALAIGLSELDPAPDLIFPTWGYGVAALLLASCLAWLWYIRRPYPGLRVGPPAQHPRPEPAVSRA